MGSNESLTAQNEEITAMNEELIAQNEAITAMNEEIASLNQNLTEMNDVLERRVAERTLELTAAHQELIAQIEELEQAQETLRRSAKIQDVLREIAEAVLMASSLSELYATMHCLVNQVLPAKNLYISLLDEANGQIVRPYCADGSNAVPLARPVGKGLTEYFMRMGHTVHVTSELFSQLREAGEVDLYFAPVFECIGAPLRDSHENIFGVITIYLTDEMSPFEGEDRKVLSIIAAQVSTAIERKRAEETLITSESRLNRAQSIAQVGDWEIELDTKQVWASAEAFRIYGIKQKSPYLSLQQIQQVVSKEDRPRMDGALKSLLKNNQKYDIQFSINRLDNGAERILHSMAEIERDRNGRPVKIIGVVQDITERKQVEEALVKSKMQRAQEIRRDAELAVRVQNALLSAPKPSEYLEITTVYRAFGYVGGDLYFMDWRYGGNLLRGFLVDATGHGLGTALHTASIHVLLREVNERDLPLSDAMRWLNRRVGEYFDEATFAGALGFELDLETRQLSWVCAGIAKTWMATKTRQGVVECPGMCLGIHAEEAFDTHLISVEIGDSFYFMTDGLSDQLERRKELPLQQYSEMTHLLEMLSEADGLRDDATAICIQVRSLPHSLVPQDGWPRVIRFNGYGDYQRLKGEVAKILTEVTGLPHSLQEVAIHEALANAMECRDGVPRQHTARLRFNKVGKWFVVRVKSSRMGFAGNAILRRLRSHPEDMFSFGEDASMGRGIPLMLSMSHKMTYNSEGTEVLLAWKLTV